ncbi:methyltransferase domain-containing protein [Nonomuraea sp. NPDC050328]|uniref:methyltransferase domain-containing protein n=1 Tax=Nonomuraea sp. NPDC050328 TaxID=3364361 RepID=UPI00379E6EA5
MHPADFYTGIVADLYGPLKSYSQEAAPYASFIREAGQPALELGCGDGDPLLALLDLGLDVDGVDSSADMLDRCRARSTSQREPALYHQRMESLDLPRHYWAVFLAGPTFTLLPDDATALAALRAIRAHLAPDGQALIPLFIPSPTPVADMGRVRTATAPDGAELRVSVVSEERDEAARTQVTVWRYERHLDGESTVEDRPWTVHWHTRAGFEALAAEAGLAVAAVESSPDGTDLRFRLRAGDNPPV